MTKVEEASKDGEDDQTVEAEQYVAVTVARAVAEAEAESQE